jgi:hypothetical protein
MPRAPEHATRLVAALCVALVIQVHAPLRPITKLRLRRIEIQTQRRIHAPRINLEAASVRADFVTIAELRVDAAFDGAKMDRRLQKQTALRRTGEQRVRDVHGVL